MCNALPTQEWSGILFYNYTGSFDGENIEFVCKDFLVMDIGSATFTEFAYNAEVIGYMTDNDLLSCNIGLIHSHDSMPTFFSGTDTNTLAKEGTDTNHFLSLIVNNAGVYSAAVTAKVTAHEDIEETEVYHTFEDRLVTLPQAHYTRESTYIKWFTLAITKQESEKFKSLESRIEEIKKTKEEAEKTMKKGLSYSFSNPYSNPNSSFPQSSTSGFYDDYGEYDDWEPHSYPGATKEPTLFSSTESTIEEEQKDTVEEDSKQESLEISSTQLYKARQIIVPVVKQLLTGSILLPNSTKIDLKSWALKMTGLFDERFKGAKNKMAEFNAWADSYVDFLVWNTQLEDLPKDADMTAIVASIMADILKELPKNEYIDQLLIILDGYYE